MWLLCCAAVLDTAAPHGRWAFALPGRAQRWHWAFTSCNGMDQDADSDKFGEPHLWGDLMERHARAPLHALVGGGDQLYNDALWTAPALRTWLGGDGQHPGTVYSDDVRAALCIQVPGRE